jgi:phospholipid/cholesterol/gamma-HCH transport system substrate-binding protein
LLTVLIVSGVCVIVFSGLVRGILAGGGETVKAVFTNTARLATGSPVRVNGVDVGTVTSIGLDPSSRSSTVTMQIDNTDALPLYRDARAALKWRTLLGANYVIDLQPGTRAAGVLDPAVIPVAHTSGQVEVDEILAALQDRQRHGLQTMVRELPRALGDQQAPARALTTLAAVSPIVAQGVGATRGETDGDLRNLVTNASRTLQSLNTPIPTLRDVVSGGASTLETTAGRRSDIESTIRLASTVLPQIRQTVGQLKTTLAIADPLIARLQPTAPAVAPTVARLLPTVVSANDLLQQARPLLDSLRPAVGSLARSAQQGLPLLQQFTPSIDRLANQILPDLAKPSKVTKRATYEMIGPTLADLDAAAASFDGVSHFVTLTAGAGERALDTLPCRSYFVDLTAPQLLQCETLSTYLEQLLNGVPIGAAK